MISWAEVVRAVETRAGGRCEYCRMHQSLQGATFHTEHIIPRSKSGTSELTNLAWCCPSCNLHKSNRTGFADPVDGNFVPLFHPREQDWREHFGWNQFEIVARTPAGSVTLLALELNSPRRILIRKAEELLGLYPP